MIAQQDFIYLINLDNPQSFREFEPLTPVLGVIECLHWTEMSLGHNPKKLNLTNSVVQIVGEPRNG
jgi:hypothetical protein